MTARNPYDKGPLRHGELPRMALGLGVLAFGTWALTRYALARAKATQAGALVVRGPAIDRGDRFAR